VAGKAEISSHGKAGAAGARLSKINTFNSKPNLSHEKWVLTLTSTINFYLHQEIL
jgi:hypothetical protein